MAERPAALVTGGSGGLGAAVARALARGGRSVAVHYAGNAVAAKRVADELDGESMVVAADVADWAQVQAMVEAVEEDLGPIEVLVNCAGIRRDGLMAGQAVDEWSAVVNVNLLGTFHTCRAVLPAMLRSRQGRIVNVVSPAGIRGSEGQTAYSASKAGVIGLTRSLARECARRRVTVNALSPGYLETAMTSSLPGDRKQQILDATPIRRAATVEEVAAAVPFIVDADYMTGQVVSIDGGLSA